MPSTPPPADPEVHSREYKVNQSVVIDNFKAGDRRIHLFQGDTLMVSGPIDQLDLYHNSKLQEALEKGWITQKEAPPKEEATDYLGVGGLLGLVALSMLTSSPKEDKIVTSTSKRVIEEESMEEASNEVKSDART